MELSDNDAVVDDVAEASEAPETAAHEDVTEAKAAKKDEVDPEQEETQAADTGGCVMVRIAPIYF